MIVAARVLLLMNGIAVLTAPFTTWWLANFEAPEWNYAGIAMTLAMITVFTGAGVSLFHMAKNQGWRAALLLMGISAAIGCVAELMGTITGFPFGCYEYTAQLGPKFAGRIPYIIPIAWFMMSYPALHVAFRCGAPRWMAAIVAASVLTLWDVALEGAMTAGYPCWIWKQPGRFYGIPVQNWVGWFLTGWLIAAVYIGTVRQWQHRQSRAPIALYAIQGSAVAAVAALHGRAWAAIIWSLGLALLLLWVSWCGRQRSANAGRWEKNWMDKGTTSFET